MKRPTVQPWHVRIFVAAILAGALAMRLTHTAELPLWARVPIGLVVLAGVANLARLAWRSRRRRPKAERTFEQRYDRFTKSQRIQHVLFGVMCLLLLVLGAWWYAIGAAVGYAFGYTTMRSRHHMEMAKANLEFAASFEQVQQNVDSAMGQVFDIAVEHAKRIGKRADN